MRMGMLGESQYHTIYVGHIINIVYYTNYNLQINIKYITMDG